MKFIIYNDRKKQFRWRLVAKTGNIIADSGEGYTRKRSVQNSLVLLCDAVLCPVIDTTIRKKK